MGVVKGGALEGKNQGVDGEQTLRGDNKERNKNLNCLEQEVQESHEGNDNGNVTKQKVYTSSTMAVHVIILRTFLCRPLPNNNVKRFALSVESEPQRLIF